MEEALRGLGKAGAHPRHCSSLVLRRRLRENDRLVATIRLLDLSD